MACREISKFRRTMSFEKLTTILCFRDIQPCSSVHRSYQSLLRTVARHRNTGRAAILVEAGFPDNALNLITVTQSLAQGL